jgi:hypothetical protein
MMGVLDYDVVNVGPNDLLYGLQTLKETAEKSGFKLVSSNILRKSTGKHLFDPYVIQEMAGFKVAFLGVVRENARLQTATTETDDFAVADVEESLKEIIPEVREKADLVVLFSHLGSRTSQKLVDEIDGIDVAFNGGDPLVNSRPFEVGNEEVGFSLVCSAGDRGKYIGALRLVVSEHGDILRHTHELHALDKNVPESEEMRARLNDFNEQLREVKKRERVESVVGQETAGPKEKFLGASVCGRCHESAYESWRESSHAHSLASLEGKSMEQSGDCLQCHVTGNKDPAGYTINKTDLAKVTCEQCHGYGTLHGSDGFVARPTVEPCKTCHATANSPHFDYASYWETIAH